ncbi:hypothetical protein BN988_03822 [Oceanobacillus picturae]|uniref:Uncharacterized protein n=1 Tax=Oceanobacillus picturae TaxID=171693 RepID=W9AQR3_9BACI|nr:hypothetical protein [Oceanobacillus picturae]CDO05232.1 hypothetical protein BN988_03822 [Oceanobacillus picturae]
MKTKRKIITKDQVEYTIDVTEKVVQLTDKQFLSLEDSIQRLESEIIEEKGINLYNIPEEQSQKILNELDRIIGEFTIDELLEYEIIDFHSHALERIGDEKICIDRRWTYENADKEIAECLKRAYSVEQVRLRFNKMTKRSWKQLAFNIKGSIGRGAERRDGNVVINFDEDPLGDEQVMVITILEPEYK